MIKMQFRCKPCFRCKPDVELISPLGMLALCNGKAMVGNFEVKPWFLGAST